VCQLRITEYGSSHNNSQTQTYFQHHPSAYDRFIFESAFGRSSYEAYFILTCAWGACVVAFFVVAERL
jgi:hypothetical protein